jgi:hypothetical protein
MMLIVADADLVESFLLVAVTVAVAFWVTVGAVKLPWASTVPPPVPLTDQVTPKCRSSLWL